MKTYEEIAEEFYEIIEELYDSAYAINTERINKNVRSLCETFGIDTRLIEDGLCVVHWKKREMETTPSLSQTFKTKDNPNIQNNLI